MELFISVSPEIFLLSATGLILLIDLFLKPKDRIFTYSFSLIALLLTMLIIALTGHMDKQWLLHGAYLRDPLSDLLKIALLGIAFLVLVYSKHYLINRHLFKGEFYILNLLASLGMMIMVSAGNFISLYLGLELLALSLYALVAFDIQSQKGAEAAMKYFVLGAIASSLLLYGISIIYGLTGGQLRFDQVAAALARSDQSVVVMFGVVFILIGIGFKFGAVPFHTWVPDVYQGAPMVVTALIGSAPKIAAIAMIIRLLVESLAGLGLGWQGWQGMLIILALLSIVLGNIVAIAQTNIKRMLAYSTIGHIGFILLGIAAGNEQGLAGAVFYTLIYALTSVGGFGLLSILSRQQTEAEDLDDLKGLNHRSPWLAALMLLFIFSMAGVPPLAGFFAKLFILQALIQAGWLGIAILIVLLSVVAAYYYLKIIKSIYFDDPIEQAPIQSAADAQLAISLNGLAILYYGLFPASLFALCLSAIQHL